jgi:hypothetical protein
VKSLRLIALLPLLLASCASDKDQKTTSAPARKSMNQRMTESNGYKQDAKGNWVPQNDRRSEFESQSDSNYAKKNYKKTDYKTGDYAKKSWWGNKEYDRPTYTGNTDGSRFQKSSALQGQSALEGGDKAKLPGAYKTDDYTTSTAREAGNKPIEKSSNAIVESRQKVFQPPEIIDWKEQRNLSLDQSKGILGR